MPATTPDVGGSGAGSAAARLWARTPLPARLTLGLAVFLLLTALAVGRPWESSDGPAQPVAGDTRASSSPQPQATRGSGARVRPVRVRLGQVVGPLPAATRRRVADVVGEVVTGWLARRGAAPGAVREVVLDVLARDRRAVGVTSRVRMADVPDGRVYLARDDGAWRVFGYDLPRPARAGGGGR